MVMEFQCSDVHLWKEALTSYKSRIESLNKPKLVSLDDFYTNELPPLIRQRNPNPYITTSELSKLMEWKLTRGKWRHSLPLLSLFTHICVYFYLLAADRSIGFRPRLLNFVSSLDEVVVKSASQKAFQSLPDVSKAVSELTVLKGVGPATASAVLAAFAPEVAPFMSDEAMIAVLGNSKDYTMKQYLVFVDKLQAKAKELSSKESTFTPSDVERALWSSSIGAKLPSQPAKADIETKSKQNSKRKRKQ